jgi:hypothetical protein
MLRGCYRLKKTWRCAVSTADAAMNPGRFVGRGKVLQALIATRILHRCRWWWASMGGQHTLRHNVAELN